MAVNIDRSLISEDGFLCGLTDLCLSVSIGTPSSNITFTAPSKTLHNVSREAIFKVTLKNHEIVNTLQRSLVR